MTAWSFLVIGGVTVGALSWVWFAAPGLAVVTIGWGLLGAMAGGATGMVVGGHLGIDGSRVLIMTDALVGAGWGWLLGSALGLALSRHGEPVQGTNAWVLRGLAGVAVLGGILTAQFQSSLVVVGGYGEKALPGAQKATTVDALLVALVLAVVAGTGRQRPATREPGPTIAIARAGIFLGALASALGLLIVATSLPTSVARR